MKQIQKETSLNMQWLKLGRIKDATKIEPG